MYVTICKIDEQCKFDARSGAPEASALGYPRGMWWGGRWVGFQDGGEGNMCIPVANSC